MTRRAPRVGSRELSRSSHHLRNRWRLQAPPMRGQRLNDLPRCELERRSSHHKGIFFRGAHLTNTALFAAIIPDNSKKIAPLAGHPAATATEPRRSWPPSCCEPSCSKYWNRACFPSRSAANIRRRPRGAHGAALGHEMTAPIGAMPSSPSNVSIRTQAQGWTGNHLDRARTSLVKIDFD